MCYIIIIQCYIGLHFLTYKRSMSSVESSVNIAVYYIPPEILTIYRQTNNSDSNSFNLRLLGQEPYLVFFFFIFRRVPSRQKSAVGIRERSSAAVIDLKKWACKKVHACAKMHKPDIRLMQKFITVMSTLMHFSVKPHYLATAFSINRMWSTGKYTKYHLNYLQYFL